LCGFHIQIPEPKPDQGFALPKTIRIPEFIIRNTPWYSFSELHRCYTLTNATPNISICHDAQTYFLQCRVQGTGAKSIKKTNQPFIYLTKKKRYNRA
jgi:hypothetical protein